MERPEIALTAVFMRDREGYVGFIEELPNVNCHARSLDEARSSLRRMVAVVFEEERRNSAAPGGRRTAARCACARARLLAGVLRRGRVFFARKLAVVVLVELREVLLVWRPLRLLF